jgi:hypothetical protein
VSAVSDKPPLEAEDAGRDRDRSERFGQCGDMRFLNARRAITPDRDPPESIRQRGLVDRRDHINTLIAKIRRLSA